ncbi:unnamed protein product (macronuclear) [Paramecium tetraurelia]|uniref:Uncharacterized protein n=1 Tax=Paramecium tetraurelia TaxID=5888 RepID=A0D1I4_PARTE|nr:uncharacterized protein GSPATT00012425001 [Paramecium tetraurelia]CAK76901.1 unnamed protein product [Paramecium tetraurelia]|eukprot:XP_001444298.1 hypothetical protein (macronuclear) [Paramecium tetraurelia strain d4-2]
MNQTGDQHILNHQLNIQNNKLSLQVEVLTQQVQLLIKQNQQLQAKVADYQNLKAENITLKKDIMNLQEKIQEQESEQLLVQETLFNQHLEEMQKKHKKQIQDLKTIYEDKIISLQRERSQMQDQTVQMGISNQASKTLEQQAAKIIQISQKLEKTLSDLPTQSPSHGHIGISKEMYDQMLEQLKSKSSKNIILEKIPDQQNFSLRYKKTSITNIKKEPNFGIKRNIHHSKPYESPQTQNSGIALTISTLTKRS